MVSGARKQAAATQLFDGRYLLGEVIGRGRQSIVYRAEQLDPSHPLHRHVALKMVFGGNKAPESVKRRVRREALGMLAARSPHTIRLLDYTIEAEQPYLVMEYAERGDLKAYVTRQGGSLEVGEAIDYILQTLRGLSSVHRVGMIHRDIKAENLLLTSQKCVKIADFSIASVPKEYLSLEQANPVVGTFDYLAPESLTDGISSKQSDLYSVAMTLYELISGVYPFGDGPFSEQVQRKLAAQWTPLPEGLRDLPPLLPDFLSVALASSPSDRFKDTQDFIEALEGLKHNTWKPTPRLLIQIPEAISLIKSSEPEATPSPEEEPIFSNPFNSEQGSSRKDLHDADSLEEPAASEVESKDFKSSSSWALRIFAALIGIGVAIVAAISWDRLLRTAEAPEPQLQTPDHPVETFHFVPTFSVRIAESLGMQTIARIALPADGLAIPSRLLLKIGTDTWSLPLVQSSQSSDLIAAFPTPKGRFSLSLAATHDGKEVFSPEIPVDIDCKMLRPDGDQEAILDTHPKIHRALSLAARVDYLTALFEVVKAPSKGPLIQDQQNLPPAPKGLGLHRFSCLLNNPTAQLLTLPQDQLQQLMELRESKVDILETQLASMKSEQLLQQLNARAEAVRLSDHGPLFPPSLFLEDFYYRLALLSSAESAGAQQIRPVS